MIVISREAGQEIIIGNRMAIRVLKITPDAVWIDVAAPRSTRVLKAEDEQRAAAEPPLERVERGLAELKSLPDIVLPCIRPVGMLHLGPWSGLDEQTKDELLQGLDWSGVDAADFGRISAREISDYELIWERSPRWVEPAR